MAMQTLTDGLYTHKVWTGLVVRIESDTVIEIVNRPSPLRYWGLVESSWLGLRIPTEDGEYFEHYEMLKP